MERVSVIQGRQPLIVVAPHGYEQDDQHTATMAEYIASELNCYAVINRGWERCQDADVLNDKADCNNAYHCVQDVVREEFLEPIIRFKNRILRTNVEAKIIYLHGMGNRHRQISKDPSLGAVIGYGAGDPSRFTCELWQKDLLLHSLNLAGIKAYQGRKGGPMSGWSKSNMNQYFRLWEMDEEVHSFQLEIIYDLRKDAETAKITASYLAHAFMTLVRARGFTGVVKFGSY